MNCTEAREAMLVAEPSELGAAALSATDSPDGPGDSLAEHLAVCDPCRRLAGLLAADLDGLSFRLRARSRRRRTMMLAALPIAAVVVATATVTARRSSQTPPVTQNRAVRSAERGFGRRRRRTKSGGDQDRRPQDHSDLDFLREPLMKTVRRSFVLALAVTAATSSAAQTGRGARPASDMLIAIANLRLRGNISTLSGIYQNCRMMAVMQNRTMTTHFSTGPAGIMAYVKLATDAGALVKTDTQVHLQRPIIQHSSSASNGGPADLTNTTLGFTGGYRRLVL